MHEPLACLNGQFIPAAQAVVPVTDAGFMLGATVSEQLRTFGERLFRLDEHLARFARSLAIAGIDLPVTADELADAARRLVAANRAAIDADDDLGLSLFATPGTHATFSAAEPSPLWCLHTYALPFSRWADKYEAGQALVSIAARQVPSSCWPAELKCRSRMHYYLADREAAATDPGARALVYDQRGMVNETATANVLAYFDDVGLVSPPVESILRGISLDYVRSLAADLGIPWSFADLHKASLAAANEIMLTSTPYCILPVTRLDRAPVGGRATHGPIYQRLLAAWSERLSVDIAAQARRFATRGCGAAGSPLQS